LKPTIGRIVHYTLGESDVANIVERRAHSINGPDVGNRVEVGQVYPAMIVRVHGDAPTSYVNLQVFLDGRDTEWVTSRAVGMGPGTYSWPGVVSPPSQPIGVGYGDRI